MSASNRKRYLRLKAEGLCVTCARVAPEPGRVRCRSCLDDILIANTKRDPESNRRWKQKMLAQCRCVQCGQRAEPPTDLAGEREARRLCTRCRVLKAELARKRWDRKFRTSDKQLHCQACGEPGHLRATCPAELQKEAAADAAWLAIAAHATARVA